MKIQDLRLDKGEIFLPDISLLHYTRNYEILYPPQLRTSPIQFYLHRDLNKNILIQKRNTSTDLPPKNWSSHAVSFPTSKSMDLA